LEVERFVKVGRGRRIARRILRCILGAVCRELRLTRDVLTEEIAWRSFEVKLTSVELGDGYLTSSCRLTQKI
jgi:hypothetical protein